MTFQGAVAGSGAPPTLHFHAHGVWSKGANVDGPPDHLDFSITHC